MIEKMIREARSQRASDIHISEGQAVYLRIDGKLIKSDLELSDEMTRKLILSLLTKERQESIWRGEDADFALETSDGNRQRVNVFCQQGRLAAAIRLLNAKVPTLSQLHLPPVLQNLANEPRGLILVTGPTGSGKSTTLAAMVDYINHTRADHILTIEDPIEALTWFFAAVILVIVATYMLFIAGSVTLCRILQKNKGFYYRKQHFISIASMSYRMKRNGAGLASICVLSTMVLVMLSSTICLYAGVENIMRERYPRDLSYEVHVSAPKYLNEESEANWRQLMEETFQESHLKASDVLEYTSAFFFTGSLKVIISE